MLRVALLVLTLVWATACSETPKAVSIAAVATAADAATEQLLNDMEGVWRPTDPEQRGLVYVLRDGRNLRLLYGGVYETDVQLRSVDVNAQSVNRPSPLPVGAWSGPCARWQLPAMTSRATACW